METTERRTYGSGPVHSVIIQRTTSTYTTPGTKTSSRSSRVGGGGGDVPSFTEGAYSMMTASGVDAVKTSREQEKKEMQDLNDRFANYIEKVRLLEAQNRKLADELDKLKTKWGKETAQIKAMYQAELDEARRALDDAEKEKARLEIKVASLEEQIEELRLRLEIAQQELIMYTDKMKTQTQTISDYEIEIQFLRKQLEGLESEKEKDKKRIEDLKDMLAKTRQDLDNETLEHIDAENRRQTLEEEIEFLKAVHDKEMKELAALAYRDTAADNRNFWKNEMTLAISDIEEMYAKTLESMRLETESNYNLKLQEMRTGATRQAMETTKSKDDTKDLRNALTDLRDKINDLENQNAQLLRDIEALRREKDDVERELLEENNLLRGEADSLRYDLDAIMRELQSIMDAKMGLELEIAAYRKLLEGEETRISGQSRSAEYMSIGGGGNQGQLDDEVKGLDHRGEMSAKTTYQRTAKGALAISECPPDGKLVRLENTGRKEENAEGWKVRRIIDGDEKSDYVLDNRFSSIPPGTKIGIWAKGAKGKTAGPKDIEMDEASWGVGMVVITRLFNKENEERANLTQRTSFS